MSANSGVTVAAEVIEKFTRLKLKKAYKYIIMRLSDKLDEVIVEHASECTDWDEFRQRLIEAQFKGPHGYSKGPRYAVYDLHYETSEGSRTKMLFISWSPDDASIKAKMTYASSKDTVKRSLHGVHVEIQANDQEDLEYKNVVERATS